MEAKTKYKKGVLTKGEKALWEAVKKIPEPKGSIKLNVTWRIPKSGTKERSLFMCN
jgi:hypothetical protein